MCIRDSATAVLAWQGLGFGFAELGTVTGRAQPGNQLSLIHI